MSNFYVLEDQRPSKVERYFAINEDGESCWTESLADAFKMWDQESADYFAVMVNGQFGRKDVLESDFRWQAELKWKS